LDDLKFGNNPAALSINQYLNADGYYSQINDFKTKVYEIIYKIMNMKIKKNMNFDISKLEKVMLTAVELKVWNPK